MAYDVEAIRRKLKDSMSGRFNDPDEFKPEKAVSQSEAIKYRGFVLPPIQAGDKLKSGVVKQSMDQFYIAHGNHWIDNRPYPCPRIWDNSPCEICTHGFELIGETKDQEARSAIAKVWMPQAYNMVNIYFPPIKPNPEALHNTVKFYNAPKTCLDIWAECILKKDSGDEDDPTAFGIFYDENAAFLFELQVLKQGKANSYKTSRFIANKGMPIPIVKNADGKPNSKGIDAVLMLRLNLWDKIEIPDPIKITSLANKMLKGDDSGDDNSGGFDHDEEKKPTKSVVETKTESKPKTKKAKEPDPEDDDVVSQLNNSNLDNETPIEGKVAKVETKVETKVATPKPEEDDDDNEIQALLSQLEDV